MWTSSTLRILRCWKDLQGQTLQTTGRPPMVLTMWPSILSKKLSMTLSRVLTMMRSQQECIVQNQKTGTIHNLHQHSNQRDKDRREGKGRRCCLGDRLYSIPYHYCQATSFCAQGRIEEFDELHQDDLKKRLNSSYSLKLSWWKIAGAARNWINYVPQTAATTFAFASDFILLLWLRGSAFSFYYSVDILVYYALDL